MVFSSENVFCPAVISRSDAHNTHAHTREVIKPGLDSGLEWNLESLHTRTRML